MKYPISFFILTALLSSCESDYTKLVKSELAKGIRKDSVLLGFRFGNTRNEFNGRCYDLNREHLLSEGAGHSVQYLFSDSLVHQKPTEIRLLFMPAFDDNEIISNIDLNFSYVAWAPCNRQLYADSLEKKVKLLLMRWYGGNEFVIANIGDNKVPVKVDGNRRILVYRDDPQRVIVRVEDILHPKYRRSVGLDDGTEGAKK